jgi:hypothetical protein
MPPSVPAGFEPAPPLAQMTALAALGLKAIANAIKVALANTFALQPQRSGVHPRAAFAYRM